MGPVIELCRTCGFDIPADADHCPGCYPVVDRPSLAARQVAGLALPTRSVHRLPNTAPRREHTVRSVGRARAARSAFSFTTILAAVTCAAASLAWAVTQPRFVLQVPSGTADALDDLTTVSAAASVVGLALGLVAMVLWCGRRAAIELATRLDRRHHA